MKRTPDELSQEFRDFWKQERDKCKNGIYIDNIFISGFLYWHLNYFKCQLDVLENGRIVRKLANPYLRDNEWLIDGYIRQAEEEKAGCMILGSRRLAKSVFEASYICHRATFFKGTQNVIAGLNEPDIKVITDLSNEALIGLPKAFKKGRPENNWKKQVTLGAKTASGEVNPWSFIPIRNLDGGKNTEALAGLTPFSMVIDEVGKGDWLDCFSAAIPGFATPYGWRCSPLAFGTSGDMEKASDARKVFESPSAYNFLAVEIPEENVKRAVFISGHYAHDFPKKEISLVNYLKLDNELYPNLNKTKILVTDFEVAEKGIDAERKMASESSDNNALMKITMYHPKNIHELFLTESGNNFPIDAINAYQEWLKENYEPEYIEFVRDASNKLSTKYSSLKPIFTFPVSGKDDKNAPIVIYERPLDGVPPMTYVIGVDSYNKNESSDKINSLGSIYVFKRTIDPLGDYQHSIVASYSGRPSEIYKFYQIAMDLCEYYNAIGTLLPETNERFSDFFVNKKKGYYLHDSIRLARDISPTTQVRSELGLAPTTRNQNYYMELMVQYAMEELSDNKGGINLGVTRIKDIMLLEEMKNYRKKKSTSKGIHDGNFDRIIAFGHALTLAEHLDKNIPIQNQPKLTFEEVLKKREINVNTFFGKVPPKQNSIFYNPNYTTRIKKPKGFNFL